MGWTAKKRKYSYRRNLPHLQKDARALFVTFRTYGNIELPPAARDIVLETCLLEHGTRIDLYGVAVMPTHVHMVFTPLLDETKQAYTLAEVLNAIKSVSAHKINHRVFRSGHVWQDESFDHVLRHNESVAAKVLYLMENPVAAGLVRSPLDYKWLWRQGADDLSTRGGACATKSRG
jgi:REP element-mobilizing transposase RayT